MYLCREHANLSITLVGVDSGEVLGHMALFDYPNVRNMDQADWESWLHENYQCKKASVHKNAHSHQIGISGNIFYTASE